MYKSLTPSPTDRTLLQPGHGTGFVSLSFVKNRWTLALFFALTAASGPAYAGRCSTLAGVRTDERNALLDLPPVVQRYQFRAGMYGAKLISDTYERSWLEQGAKDFPTVDQFLSMLPASLRRSHTLGIRSESTQFGDIHTPRAILSNSDSTFLMSYSGEPKKHGFQSLEFVIFDRENAEFVPYEIKIAKNGTLEKITDRPQKCASCHGVPFRPIWKPYSFWSGFYGSIHGDSHGVANVLAAAEVTAFDEFLNQTRDTQRYRFLLGNKSIAELADVNSALSYNLAELNALRVKKITAQLTHGKPRLQNLLKIAIAALASALPQSENIIPFLLPAEQTKYLKNIASLVEDTKTRLEHIRRDEIAQQLKAFDFDTSDLSAIDLWSKDIGISNHDANVLFNSYRSDQQNRAALQSYILKMANLRFVVEVLGKGSISEWAMSSIRKPTLPLVMTPISSGWKFLF